MKFRDHLNEVRGRFSDVDLGDKSPSYQVKKFRRNLAEGLKELINDNELDPNMKLKEVIKYLSK